MEVLYSSHKVKIRWNINNCKSGKTASHAIRGSTTADFYVYVCVYVCVYDAAVSKIKVNYFCYNTIYIDNNTDNNGIYYYSIV